MHKEPIMQIYIWERSGRISQESASVYVVGVMSVRCCVKWSMRADKPVSIWETTVPYLSVTTSYVVTT